MCRAGRSAPSQCEMVVGVRFRSPINLSVLTVPNSPCRIVKCGLVAFGITAVSYVIWGMSVEWNRGKLTAMNLSKMNQCAGALFGLAALLAAAPVSAQGVDIDSGVSGTIGAGTTAPSNRWRYMIGIGAGAVPDYEGSDDAKGAPLPIFRAQKGHQYGQLFGLKLSSNLVNHPNFRLGPVAGLLMSGLTVEHTT